MSVGGGCEPNVTPRSICKSVKLRESGELLCGRFCLKLKGVYIARPAILHRCEKRCKNENEMIIL